MKTSQSILAVALLAAGASAIASQPANAGAYWDAGCGCQRTVAVQPYVPPPTVVNVVRPRVVYKQRVVYQPRVVYQRQVVYESVPAYVAPAPAPIYSGCGACGRGLLTGYAGYSYGHHVHYGAGYGYGASYGYGPTD
jgi:hypothetical protein